MESERNKNSIEIKKSSCLFFFLFQIWSLINRLHTQKIKEIFIAWMVLHGNQKTVIEFLFSTECENGSMHRFVNVLDEKHATEMIFQFLCCLFTFTGDAMPYISWNMCSLTRERDKVLCICLYAIRNRFSCFMYTYFFNDLSSHVCWWKILRFVLMYMTYMNNLSEATQKKGVFYVSTWSWTFRMKIMSVDERNLWKLIEL